MSVPYVDWVSNEPRIVDPVGRRADFDEALRLNRMIAENRLIDAPVLAFRFLQGMAWLLGRDMLGRNPDNASNVSDHGDATLAFLLERIRDESRALGAATVFLHVPELSVPATLVPGEIVDVLPPDVVLVDTAPALNAYGQTSSRPLSVPGDGHPNAAAHRVIARAIEPVIADRLAATASRGGGTAAALARAGAGRP